MANYKNILENIQRGQFYPSVLEFIDVYGQIGKELLDNKYLKFDGKITLTLKGIEYLESLKK